MKKEVVAMPKRTRKKTIENVQSIVPIVDEAARNGDKLSVRQIYYIGVASGAIPSGIEAYEGVEDWVKKGRLWGLLDWDVVEDRERSTYLPYWYDNPEEAISHTIDQYRVDRMEGQEREYVIFLEKKSLQNPFIKIGNKYHIKVLPCKGNLSLSWYYRMAKRLDDGDVILAFYDLDPKGLRIRRETITKQFKMFGRNIEVIDGGLTIEQVNAMPEKPIPFPVKLGTDTDAKWFKKETGSTDAYELDTLGLRALEKLCEDTIRSVVDIEQYQYMLDVERDHIAQLNDFKNNL